MDSLFLPLVFKTDKNCYKRLTYLPIDFNCKYINHSHGLKYKRPKFILNLIKFFCKFKCFFYFLFCFFYSSFRLFMYNNSFHIVLDSFLNSRVFPFLHDWLRFYFVCERFVPRFHSDQLVLCSLSSQLIFWILGDKLVLLFGRLVIHWCSYQQIVSFLRHGSLSCIIALNHINLFIHVNSSLHILHF